MTLAEGDHVVFTPDDAMDLLGVKWIMTHPRRVALKALLDSTHPMTPKALATSTGLNADRVRHNLRAFEVMGWVKADGGPIARGITRTYILREEARDTVTALLDEKE